MRKWKPALWVLCAAAFAVLPMAFRGISCGHDLNFHLLSWMEAARDWHAGLLYPHWIEDANYGAGEPRLIFYPPASWFLGAALGSLISWAAAPALFVFVVLLGCGWSMYRLAREWLSAEISTFAACLYIANPYMLFVGYERSAYGELLAGVWIPLIVLFSLRRSSSLRALGLTVGAVWLTNAPAALMAGYMLGVLALVMTVVERKAWPALRAAGGMVLGLALAGFYVVPAAYERRWVEIGRALQPGFNIDESFLFGQKGDSLHNQVLRQASWIMILELGAAAVALCLCRRYRGGGASTRIALAVLLALTFLLQFPASAPIWNHAPQMEFLQFPWRWLLVVSVAMCFLVGMALARKTSAGARRRKRFGKIGAAMLVLVGMVIVSTDLFFEPSYDTDAVPAQIAAFRTGLGVEGTDEYTPAGADNSAIQQGLPLVRVLAHPQDDSIDSSQIENPPWRSRADVLLPSRVQVQRKNAEDWTIQVMTQAPQIPGQTPGYAVLRLMDYPAWKVTSNGALVRDRPSRNDGLMTIPLSRGKNTIVVRWRDTRDVIAGRVLSATALVLFIASYTRERRSLHKRSRNIVQSGPSAV